MIKKNLYQVTYEDKEIEFILETKEERKIEDKRLKNLKVKFTTEIVNHLVKHIDYK